MKQKRIALSLLFVLVMVLSLAPTAFAAGSGTAYPSTQTVTVDGKPVEFQMYALKDAKGNDTNYVKLRDVAYVLNNTPVSFDVDYQEATGIIEIWTEVPYLGVNGTEMKTPFSGNRSYTSKSVTIQYDYFWEKKLDAIVLTDDNGGGYTYFKLRDLGSLLGFQVDWSAERGVMIETGLRTLSQTAMQVPEKADEVIALVNAERAKMGLKPLSTYPALTEAAQLRAAELIGYYSHTRPDGTNWDTVLPETGADQMVIASGENIANGTMAQNASGAMAVWMNSPGHRANILNPNFTHIGVGCVYSTNDPYRFYWVQNFTGVDGTPAGNVQAEPVQSTSGRVSSTDPLFELGKNERYTVVNGGGSIFPAVDEAWVAAHGAYTAEWSVDAPNVVSIEPGSNYVAGVEFEMYLALAPGEATITCKITGEDGTTAEAYCYITVTDR